MQRECLTILELYLFLSGKLANGLRDQEAALWGSGVPGESRYLVERQRRGIIPACGIAVGTQSHIKKR